MVLGAAGADTYAILDHEAGKHLAVDQPETRDCNAAIKQPPLMPFPFIFRVLVDPTGGPCYPCPGR